MMERTRVCPAALHVLQCSALIASCSFTVFSPLIVISYLLISLFIVPMIIFGLYSAADDEGLPEGFRLYKCPNAIVLVPVYLVLGLLWALYALILVVLHPFVLLVYELLRLFGLCSARVVPDNEAPVADVETCGDGKAALHPSASEPQGRLEQDTSHDGGSRRRGSSPPWRVPPALSRRCKRSKTATAATTPSGPHWRARRSCTRTTRPQFAQATCGW